MEFLACLLIIFPLEIYVSEGPLVRVAVSQYLSLFLSLASLEVPRCWFKLH